METRGLQNALSTLVHKGLAHAETDLLVHVAEGLWYSRELPDLVALAPELRPDAGYVVDRLARFNVVARERKLALFLLLEPWRPDASDCAPDPSRDPLAVQWGASADLTRRMAELLPYQTRQYALDRAKPATGLLDNRST